MKRLLVVGCLAGALGASASLAKGQGATGVPSSEIPDRREFPIDDSVSPCQNFYGYACNKAIAGFKLRDDRSSHTFSFDDSRERLLNAKREYLDKLLTSTAKLTPRSQELKDVYQACMSEKAAKIEEPALVKARLAAVQALKTNADFQNFIAQAIASRDYSVFDFGNIANQSNPEAYDLLILADAMTLPERSYYAQPEVMKDFEGLLTEFFKAIKMDRPAERAKAVAVFEKEFAQTYPLPAEFRQLISSPARVTRADLARLYPRIKLERLLAQVPEGTEIRDLTPANFAWMDKALETTPLDTLKSVYLWHDLDDVLDDAYPAFYQKLFAFKQKHLGGPAKRPVRAERCTMKMMHDFGMELDAELVDKVFPDFPAEKFVTMAEHVRGAIIAGLTENTWLTPEAKKEAIQKMKVAKLQLVKPQNEREWDFMPPADYAPMTPRANARLYALKASEKALAEMREPRNRDQWSMGPLTVNAYYSPADNKFVMPIGILQYPFYDPKLSEIQNLGAIGTVIGHELGHGVDDQGSKYDSEGKLRQWMTAKDLEEFRGRSQKLVAQFDGAGHNGQLTLGENIGDLVGLTFAYRAAFPQGKGSPEEMRAFFTQYARAWCQVMRPKYREQRLRTDPHAMGDARVNEQVKHQPAFQEVFGCKKGDALYLDPSQRVTIW